MNNTPYLLSHKSMRESIEMAAQTVRSIKKQFEVISEVCHWRSTEPRKHHWMPEWSKEELKHNCGHPYYSRLKAGVSSADCCYLFCPYAKEKNDATRRT